MNTRPESSRLNKNFYAKMSATTPSRFSEEMQRRRKPFLSDDTESINARIFSKRSNKENTDWSSEANSTSPYIENRIKKAAQLPGKNIASTTLCQTKVNSIALKTIDLSCKEINTDSTYVDKSEIEISPIKSNSNVEELLEIRKEKTELKLKLGEKSSYELINFKATSNETPNIKYYANKNETGRGIETPKSQKVSPSIHFFAQSTDLKESLAPLRTTPLIRPVRTIDIETHSPHSLSLITDKPYNPKKETLNESMRIFTNFLKPFEINENELCEMQSFTEEEICKEISEISGKGLSLITDKTFTTKRETLIKKINILRKVLILTSQTLNGNETSGYLSLTEEDFNTFKIESLINSTPVTNTATNDSEKIGQSLKLMETSGNETSSYNSLCMANKIFHNGNSETDGESFKSINCKTYDQVDYITAEDIMTSETNGNETTGYQSSLIETFKSLTNILQSCVEETNGNETNCFKVEDESKNGVRNAAIELKDIELIIYNIANYFGLLRDKFIIKGTYGNETNLYRSSSSVGEEQKMFGYDFKNCDNSSAENKIQQLTFKETNGIETPKYLDLTKLRQQTKNKEKNISFDEDFKPTTSYIRSKESNGIKTLKKLPKFYNRIKAIGQIPRNIIEIHKKCLLNRAQNTKIQFITKENEIKILQECGIDNQNEPKKGKKSPFKLKLPKMRLRQPKNVVNSAEFKGLCRNGNETEHMKQIERKDKVMAELLNRAVTIGFPHLKKCEKTKQGECDRRPINIEKYGEILYDLWCAIKRHSLDEHVNVTKNERTNDRQQTEDKKEHTSREMEMVGKGILMPKKGENQEKHPDIVGKKEEILMQKEIKKINGIDKQGGNEGEGVLQQPEIVGKMEPEKLGKFSERKSNLKKRLCNYFSKQEKATGPDAKNQKENCTEEENDAYDQHIESINEKRHELFLL